MLGEKKGLQLQKGETNGLFEGAGPAKASARAALQQEGQPQGEGWRPSQEGQSRTVLVWPALEVTTPQTQGVTVPAMPTVDSGITASSLCFVQFPPSPVWVFLPTSP